MAQTGAPIKALFMGRRRAADREDAARGIFFSFFSFEDVLTKFVAV